MKADEILNNVGKEVLIFISEYDIANFYHSGILDKLKKTKYSLSKVDDGLPTCILADDEQLLLLIRTNNGKKKVAALWTNYDAFIRALKALFLELWSNEA